MIMASNVLGIIYSNVYDECVNELTSLRTMGSIPFAGRYRLIDFVLSGMVNAGITKIGVSTKANYQSLLDHLGSGKPWDLSRKVDGLTILPPFNIMAGGSGVYGNRIEAIAGMKDYLAHTNKEYVIFSDCNVIANIDYDSFIDGHIASGADISIAYKNGDKPKIQDLMNFGLDGEKIRSVRVGEFGECAYSLNIIIIKKTLLEQLIDRALSFGAQSFELDVIGANVDNLFIRGVEIDSYAKVIDSIQAYYDISMGLIAGDYKKLFTSENPVYTKVRDDMPTIYGLSSKASNSLIADGCIIKGTVENSILFRGVNIADGAVVKNSIIMQDTYVSEGAKVNCAILDKGVFVKPGVELSGSASWPLYIGKSKTV